MPTPVEIAGDVVTGGTALAGLVIVYMGLSRWQARVEQLDECSLSGRGSHSGVPGIESLAAQDAMSAGGGQMTADVEGVVAG